MKTRLLFLMLFIGIISISEAQVAINQEGNDPHESAMLDVSSTDKGLLIPRMSSAERTAIINPANGLMVFDNSTNTFWFYSEATSQWEEMGGAIVSVLNDLLDAKTDANSIYVGNTSGQSNDGNNFNTSIGSKSMKNNTAGSHNIALGYRSLTNNTIGSDNVALGENSLAASISGNENTVIGKNAGASIGDDASGNIFLGYEAGKTEIGSNKLYIENSDSPTPLIGGDFDTDEVQINGDLEVAETLTVLSDIDAQENLTVGLNTDIGTDLSVGNNASVGQDINVTNNAIIGHNLNVNDSISTQALKITGGTIADGKILTSDANGNASWQDAAASGAQELNELSDAKTDANSIYIGEESGMNDNGDHFNVAVGANSLKNNVNGKNNTAIGYSALQDKTSGDNNTAVGHLAMEQNTNGIDNTVLGANALSYNQTGNNNVAIGSNALQLNTGASNTALGSGAGSNSGSTTGNVFIGYEAGKNETQSNKLYIENSMSFLPLIGGDFDTDEVVINGTLSITGGNPEQGKVLTTDDSGNASWETVDEGAHEMNELTDAKTDDNSVYVGAESGMNDQGNNFNTSLGQLSLKMNTTGQGNTAIGLGSLQKNTTGKENTALGLASMYSNQTGENNVAIGYTALGYYNTAGSGNVAVGDRSLLMNEGSENTALGKGAGQNSNDNASGNVFIGYEAGKEENGSNKLYIENSASNSPLIGGDFDTDEVTINGELKVQEELTAYDEATIYGHLNALSDINAQKNLTVNDSISTSNIKITGGNPAAGKVLTADDDGNASWEEAAVAGAQELNDLDDAKTQFKSIFIGENAGQNEIGNNSNTTIGYQTLMNNTTGGGNNVLGREALMSNTNGGGNTAIGYKSQFSNINGSNNIAIGNNTLYHNTGGNYNTAIGNNAGKGSEGNSVSGGVFIGNSAGFNETEDNKLYIENTSSSTPLIGGDFSTDEVVINGTLQITGGTPGAGKVLVSDANGKASWSGSVGANNIDDLSDAKNDNSSIFIGSAGELDDGANKNTAVGNYALNVNEIGQYNSAFGLNSLKNNNSGMHNTAMGYSSMEFNTNGIHNTAIGSGALYYNGSGSQNTALGFEAGFGSNGSNSSGNVFLGYKAGYYETGNNKLYISNSDTYYPLVYGDFDQSRLEVNGEFKVVNGALSNVKINNDKLESNVPIEANSNVEIAQTLTVNNEIIANDTIKANKGIIVGNDNDIKYAQPRTGVYRIHPSSIVCANKKENLSLYEYTAVKLIFKSGYFGGESFYAQVQLPDGVKLKKYTVYFSANGVVSSYNFRLYRNEPDGSVPSSLTNIYAYDETITELTEITKTSFAHPIIDNENYTYFIEVDVDVNNGVEFEYYGAKIEYEYTTLDH